VRDLGDADVGVRQQCPRGFKVVLCQLSWTAPRSACAPSNGKAGLGALSDQAALDLRQRAKHVKNQPPLCGRRVGALGRAAKPDTPVPQGFDGFNQLLHRPRQAVELPDYQRVAAAREFERVM